MALAPGTRLGPYEIVAPLGAGGMGEVWRASDPRLGRDVAIKALPEGFAQDPERLARFEREAKLLASLNHPNVAGIHGLEEVEGHRYLVLEFVEGETLASRIARGALPVDDALDVCRQVAAGVEAAHEAGVVHRDLKPGNVMLKGDGTVKVLDFGLAKSGSPDRPGSDPNLSASPTMTAAATTAGVILGTAAYMSPEQARGRVVDKRSDVWSFGCVLYECLTARQAFHGETVSDTIASILKTEADLSKLPAETPARVRELLVRCLTKDAKERLRDIGEARVLLGGVRVGDDLVPAAAAATRRGGVPVWVAAAAAVALAAISVVAAQFARPRTAAAPVRRLDLVADGVQVDWFFTPQLSPDGRRIAYIAKEKLWIRDLEQLDARAIADVGGLTPLIWSPDSRTLVYNDAGKLWKLAVDGGAPFTICDVPGTGTVLGATVSRSGIIAFSAWRGGMYQVPAEGGAPTLLFDIDPKRMVDFHAPSWLPNGDLLYLVHWKADPDSAGFKRAEVGVFDGRERIPIPTDLGTGDAMPVYAAGRLLFVRHDASPGLWAVSYDVGKRRTTGKPVLVAAGAASVSVDDAGSLLYMEGSDEQGLHQMVWVDRAGKVIENVGGTYPGLSGVALSPDARRIAFTSTKGGREDVWVRDQARGIDTRITFSPNREYEPAWQGPSTLSYVEVENITNYRVYRVSADGSGEKQLMTRETGVGFQQAYLAPGGSVALRIVEDSAHRRLRLADLLPDGTLGPAREFLRFRPEPDVGEVRLSPNGRFVAYATEDPGQPEAFLTRFPSGDGHWQVSTDGARRPRWAASSRELFFIGGGGPSRRSLVAVAIDDTQDPPAGRVTKLFDIDPRWLRFGEIPYDVAPDGSRFLMAREATGEQARPSRMVLVQNWEAGLAARRTR